MLMIVWWIIKPDFFRGKTLPRQSADQVFAGLATPATVGADGLGTGTGRDDLLA